MERVAEPSLGLLGLQSRQNFALGLLVEAAHLPRLQAAAQTTVQNSDSKGSACLLKHGCIAHDALPALEGSRLPAQPILLW